MSSVNKVIIVGRLGADPELRYTPSGRPVCRLSIATDRSYLDAQGTRQEQTDWHRVVAWGKQGEVCKNFLAKGRQVYIEGRLAHSNYTDKEGIKRHSTEVVSQSVVFLGRRRDNGTDGREASAPIPAVTAVPAAPAVPAEPEEPDELPF
jgi:single-strand DNA-binding protein